MRDHNHTTDTHHTTGREPSAAVGADGPVKRCSRCHEHKTHDQYNYKYKDAGILQNQCRDCSHRSSREHYERNTDLVKARTAERNARLRTDRTEALRLLRLHGRCEDCGVAGADEPLQLAADGSGQRSATRAARDVAGDKALAETVVASALLCQRCARRRAVGRLRADEAALDAGPTAGMLADDLLVATARAHGGVLGLAELRERSGWTGHPQTVANTAARLVTQGRLERVARGQYRAPAADS